MCVEITSLDKSDKISITKQYIYYMRKESEECLQCDLSTLISSLHYYEWTMPEKRRVKSDTADPSMIESIVGELGGPRGSMVAPPPQMGDKASFWAA